LIWGLAAFFFGSAVLSNFHVGFRHVLPALPFFILGAGFALARWGGHRAARVAFALSLVWLAVSSLRVYPQGISYFNEWMGGPTQGWRYLADSNIDWARTCPTWRLHRTKSDRPHQDVYLWLRQPLLLSQTRQHGSPDSAGPRQRDVSA
jgi:hypothetical protein